MTIIITGAAGFIGSSLCEYFQKNNITHLGIDNFSYGYKDNIYKNNDPLFNFIELDICDESIVNYIEKGDIVIHLAAISSLPENQSQPVKSFRNNNLGTINILEASRIKGVSHFIFASTSAVYENATNYPCIENEKIIQPNILYSLGKAHCEDYCKSFQALYGLPYTIVRFFNVYGPKNDYYRKFPPLIPYIIRELSEGRQPILHGTGLQSRDYVYIDDLINFINKIISLPIAQNNTYNISVNKVISVKDIFTIIQSKLNSTIEPIYKDESHFWDAYPTLNEGVYKLDSTYLYKEVNKFTQGDNSKAKNELNWIPEVSMETGIGKIIDYYLSKKL